MKSVSQPAVFLDRDGTINIDHGYVHKIDGFVFYPDVIETLIEVKKLDYLLVIVTNQSGIARNYFSEDDFLQLTEWMDWSLADRGVNLDGVYYCPHHPEGTIEDLAIECECRKPKPGMFIEAKSDLNIDMSKSIMVGDKWTDMVAAHSGGVAECYLVNADEETIKRYHSDTSKIDVCQGILNKFSDLLHFLKK